jgi:hypothetical protein
MCLDCLAQTLDATFGQGHKACRVAAKLKLQELEDRTGIRLDHLARFEMGRREPRWISLR